MKFIKKFINYFLKIFNLKLIKVVDQFSNSYRLVLALKEKNIDYVFDVGANEGQFTKELRHYGFEGKILSFEPILSVHEKLLKNSNKDDEWEVARLWPLRTPGHFVSVYKLFDLAKCAEGG